MSAATNALNGKTANELRTLIASGQTTTSAVIAYLADRPKLRKPSQMLLDELTGTMPTPQPAAAQIKAHKPVMWNPEHVAGPCDVIAPRWQDSTIHSASGKLLKGGALKKAHEKRMRDASQAQFDSITATHKATGGATPDAKPAPTPAPAKRDRIDVVVELGQAIVQLAQEYKALRDAEG